MTFWKILDSLLFQPLQTVFEVIYSLAYSLCGNPGLSIIALSLAMNFLVLPLYRRADAMQEEERNIEMKLSKGVAHIKKTFHGDEQMLMLQTYYRQNNYKPTYVLRGATSLFLEIPFFIAAYRFLSHLALLDGVSFGPIANLGAPDAMLVVGGLSINILPVLMTAINFVSSAIFTKGYPLKTKIQLYGMAVFFLIFLYDSPAGLVFYWTLNNLFSLVKTIFYKLKHPGKVLMWMAAAAGVCVLGYATFFCSGHNLMVRSVIGLFGLVLIAPPAVSALRKKLPAKTRVKAPRAANAKLFFLGALFLALLTGAVIPSAVLSSSPQEFMILGYFNNPVWYIVSAFCLAFGTFVIWMGIFYWLAGEKYRVWFDTAVWVLCGAAIVDYMFFGTNIGTLSSTLQYDVFLTFTASEQLINLLALFAAAVVLLLILRRFPRQCASFLAVCVIAMCVMVGVNTSTIRSSVAKVENSSTEQAQFTLSKTGKNVIVLMLDRSLDEYIPYIMNEKPELLEQFDGFTWYANTLSMGAHTNVGSAELFGGYEYTPAEMNARADESLASKQNEALKVMPVLFDEAGWQVTVCDPPYAGYQEVPDLSIYDDYPEIKAYITNGMFNYSESRDVQNAAEVSSNMQNFFRYSIVKCVPLCIQPTLYKSGTYCSLATQGSGEGEDSLYATAYQSISSPLTASGVSSSFLDGYNVLSNMTDIARVSDENVNTFMMMCNETTHSEYCLLQEPDYVPANNVDNTAFEEANHDRFTLDGQTLIMENTAQYSLYQSNMAALLKLGEWFDWLRDQGVYDNTRIILVSDHGYGLQQLEDMLLDDTAYNDEVDKRYGDTEFYYPLLMVKDFNATGFTTCEDFMTNADVPTLATDDVIVNPVNPFTGKAIDSSEKTAHDQLVLATNQHKVDVNNGNTFMAGRWYSVHDDVRDIANWTLVAEKAVLTPDGQQ